MDAPFASSSQNWNWNSVSTPTLACVIRCKYYSVQPVIIILFSVSGELSTAIANQRKFQDDLEQKWGGKKPPLTRKIIEEI